MASLSQCVDEINVSSEGSLYDNWDPMNDVSQQLSNLVNFDRQDDPLAITSTGTPGTHKLTQEETPCRFYTYNSKSATCGRLGCRYLHARTKHVEPLVLEEIILSNQLHSKTRADDGIINVGVVVAATEPGDFCIVPYSDWKCICKIKSIGEEMNKIFEWRSSAGGRFGEQSERMVPNTGVANLLSLFEDFQQFERIQRLTKHVGFVSTNQVVAVNLPSIAGKNRMEWYRAVVLEDVVQGESSTISLSLIDYGTQIEVDFNQIALLPAKLLRYPPLGYLCSVNGVSPITHRWSRRARSMFVDLVHGKDCVFELVKASYPEDGISETVPNLVELSVKVEGQYINVSEKLISDGLGLEWNPFPDGPLRKSRGLGFSQSKCCFSNTNPQISPVAENTVSRLEGHFRLLNVHGISTLTFPRPQNNDDDIQNVMKPNKTLLPKTSPSLGNPLTSVSNGAAMPQFTKTFSQVINKQIQYPVHNPFPTAICSPRRNESQPHTSSESYSNEFQKPRKSKTKWKPLKL